MTGPKVTGPKKRTRCFLSADGESFTIRMEKWSDTLPIDRLDDQIKFYTGLRDRKSGQYAATYAPTVEALKKLKQRIAEKGSQA